MNEHLLQFIWKQALFQHHDLKNSEQEPITISKRGVWNTNAGPDFLDAQIKIGNTEWFGHVELHVLTSDWLAHKHSLDSKYNNVILHVVYEHNLKECPNQIPILELKSFINIELLKKYETLMQNLHPIICHNQIQNIPNIIIEKWKERLLFERFKKKFNTAKQLWKKGIEDWKQMMYYLLCVNFGFKVNQEGFTELFGSLPLRVLEKCSTNLFQLEALLFGQAGLIPTAFQDDYTQKLEAEYHYLRRKFNLVPINPIVWKFLRLRPPNFPTIRIAQLAQLFHKIEGDLGKLLYARTIDEITNQLDCSASPYFDTHYRLSVISKINSKKHLGLSSIQNILINTVAPINFYYGQLNEKHEMVERALQLFREIPAEHNQITKEWSKIGLKSKYAFDSQSLIQLYNNYCDSKRCLDCAIGAKILK